MIDLYEVRPQKRESPPSKERKEMGSKRGSLPHKGRLDMYEMDGAQLLLVPSIQFQKLYLVELGCRKPSYTYTSYYSTIMVHITVKKARYRKDAVKFVITNQVIFVASTRIHNVAFIKRKERHKLNCATAYYMRKKFVKAWKSLIIAFTSRIIICLCFFLHKRSYMHINIPWFKGAGDAALL